MDISITSFVTEEKYIFFTLELIIVRMAFGLFSFFVKIRSTVFQLRKGTVYLTTCISP